MFCISDSLFVALPVLILSLNSKSGSLLNPTSIGFDNYNYVSNLVYCLKLRKKLLSAFTAVLSSASYTQIDLLLFLSALNLLVSATFILDESLLLSTTSILQYLLCSSSKSNFVMNFNYCRDGSNNKSYLSFAVNANFGFEYLKPILSTLISVVDKIFMGLAALPYSSKSLSSEAVVFSNQSFPYFDDLNTNNSLLLQTSFSKISTLNLDLNCYPPLAQTPPPDLPSVLSSSQLDLIFNLHSIFFALHTILFNNMYNSFVLYECSSSSIACIFQKQQFGLFFNRSMVSRGYDGPSSRTPPTLVTWPLTRSSVSFSMSIKTQITLRAISMSSLNASTAFKEYQLMSIEDKLNSNFESIVSNLLNSYTSYESNEEFSVQLFYSPSSYYANSSLSYSSVLTYSVKTPHTISPPINSNWSEILEVKSPYSPLFYAAASIEPITVTFLINPLDCLPPSCFLTCYSLPAPANNFKEYFNGTLSQSSKLVWLPNDIINGGNWTQVSTNISTQKFDSCSYLIKVTCTLPIFPFLDSGSIIIKNEQGFLPRLSGSVVVMKSLVDSNLVPTTPPPLITPINLGGIDLPLILGLTIPFGILFLAIISYLIFKFYFKTVNENNDQISLFDSAQKNDDVGDEGIEMFQKRKINKSDLVVRDELNNQSAGLIVKNDNELSLSEKSNNSIVDQNDLLNVDSINVSRTSTPDLRVAPQPPGLIQSNSLLETLNSYNSPSIDSSNLNIIPVIVTSSDKQQKLVSNSFRNKTPPKIVSSTATTRFADKMFSKFITHTPSILASPASKIAQDTLIEDLNNDDSDSDQDSMPTKTIVKSELNLILPPEFNSSLIIDMDKLDSNEN